MEEHIKSPRVHCKQNYGKQFDYPRAVKEECASIDQLSKSKNKWTNEIDCLKREIEELKTQTEI